MAVSLRRLPLLASEGATYSESPAVVFLLLPAETDAFTPGPNEFPQLAFTLLPSSTEEHKTPIVESPGLTFILLPAVTSQQGSPPPSESPLITVILSPISYPDSILLGPDEIKALWNWSSEILMESALDIPADWQWRSSIVDFVVTSPRKNPQRVPKGRGVELN